MKRIKEYKKLFKVEGPINLKELKTSYRGLVKEWHPTKNRDLTPLHFTHGTSKKV